MNKRELEFRRHLLDRMSGLWYPTIHVENHLSPGVPDLSFVLIAEGFETGWIELKSVVKSADVFVEASQHRWFERHCKFIPTCFLIEVSSTVYVVSGNRHTHLVSLTDNKLVDHAICRFSRDDLAHKLRPVLVAMTKVSNRAFSA
jgi:hypothetical protein